MSEFDADEVLCAGVDLQDDAYINDSIKYIDKNLLKVLAEKFCYDGDWHEQAWKHNVFANVGWRKSL